LKAGDISLGIAKAMTVSEDEKKILEVLALTKELYSYVNEYKVKSILKPDSVSDSNRMAKFVGLDAYTSEGGTVSKDLFEDETLLNNPDILDRLFNEKLEETANTLKKAEGWNWVIYETDSNFNIYDMQRVHGFARVYKEEGVLSEKQTERYEQLIELEDNETLDEKGVAELASLEAITEGDYLDAQKTLAGAVVYVDYNGSLEAVRGLIKGEDQEEAIVAGILQESKHAASGQTPEKPTAAYSQKFTDDMTAIRLAAVQTALLDKPEFVLDLLAFALSPASGYYNDVLGLRSDNQRNIPEFDEAFTLSPRIGGKRSDEAEEIRDKLDNAARQDTPKAFKAFRATGKKQRNTQITEFFARALKTQDADFMTEIEAEAGADIRSIWTPTASNCFKRLKGAQLDALYMSLLDLKPDNGTFKAFSVHKKAAKVEVMHNLFNDPAHQKLCGVTANQKAKIDAWTPECF